MSTFAAALALAAEGFFVFPIHANAKTPPHVKDFPATATRNRAMLRVWWEKWPNANVGISTSHYRDRDHGLLVLDVDHKPGADGSATLFDWETVRGVTIPATRTHRTPSGGSHLLFAIRGEAVPQGPAGVLGRGLDVRSQHGYVVGPGSVVPAGRYTVERAAPLAAAPPALLAFLRDRALMAEQLRRTAPVALSEAQVLGHAVPYLQHDAPLAVSGAGGNSTTYAVAAKVRGLGADEETALALMLEHYNPRCEPPWAPDELAPIVANAYRYAQNAPGAESAAADFQPLAAPDVAPPATAAGAPPAPPAPPAGGGSPVAQFNRECALVLLGSGVAVAREGHTADGQPTIALSRLDAFRAFARNKIMMVSNKPTEVFDLWLAHPARRTYAGMCFLPNAGPEIERHGAKFLNWWRGLRVARPAKGYAPPAIAREALWIEHVEENVCQGDAALSSWLMKYLGHIVQRPQEKTSIALVLRGGKGVGKNAFIERVCYLLGQHATVVSNRRFVTGHFNSAFEKCLLFVSDEAYWHGDKGSEGVLKDLITGDKHLIERKGFEPYPVENRTRIVMLSNEKWVVPASVDERRFAVLDVGAGRQKDTKFFKAMQEGMEHGGYPLLLDYLLSIDLRTFDPHAAPNTRALIDQKMHSLERLDGFWRDCLITGQIVDDDLGEPWPRKIPVLSLRSAYRAWSEQQRLGRAGAITATDFEDFRARYMLATWRETTGVRQLVVCLPPLAEARAQFAAVLGGEPAWPAEI